VRRRVLAFAFVAAVITYLDRVCISAASPDITRDLGLTPIQMGYVFSAFSLAYTIFEIPVGWWTDRAGQRRVLTRIVAGWSIFTVFTGMARSYGVLLATRFLFGSAEAGAFPALSRSLARWFPRTERAWANGVLWTGARLGGALAPAAAVGLIGMMGWRATFGVLGLTGVAWCAAFWPWYRDDPGAHPAVNAAEIAHIRAETEVLSAGPGQSPWRPILASGTMWALFAMYFCSAFGFWFFVTWMPTFLVKDHGLTLTRSGIYSSLPLLLGAGGAYSGGALSDWLARRTGSLKWARRGIGISAFGLAAAGFGAAALTHHALGAVLLLAAAEGAHDLVLPVAWSTAVDLGGPFGGTTSAFMNMASSLSATLSSVSAAWLATAFGSFNAMLVAAGGVYAVGALLWLFIDPTRPVIRASPFSAAPQTTGTRG
jgi:MFS family permease